MSEECSQRFLIGTRNWLICTGKANLPPYKLNAYRKQWGLPPLQFEQEEVQRPTQLEYNPIPELVFHGYSISEGEIPTVKKLYGPGTELLRIYENIGIPSCDACKELAQQMNNWGATECRKRLKEIVDDIFPRAKLWMTENHPWVHAFLPNIVEDTAIRKKLLSDVLAAIDESERVIKERKEKRLDVYTGEQRKGCGACG